jgi:hypothetical protein
LIIAIAVLPGLHFIRSFKKLKTLGNGGFMKSNRMFRHSAKHQELLTQAYSDFNARNIDKVLAAMHPDVEWANGMEGGHVYGHEAVRDYWTHQWKLVNPHVEPQGFHPDEHGKMVVDVHQVVRDLEGNLIADRMVQHIYTIENDLIQRMDIQELSM